MPIKATKIYVRENPSIPFFKWSVEDQLYLEQTYVATGKVLGTERSLSEDKTELTFSRIYANDAALDEYQTDPVVVAGNAARAAHNAEYSILEYPGVVEEI